MDYFKILVKEEKINPSEVWGLDLEMVRMDLTIMLNAERQMNGAPREVINYGD